MKLTKETLRQALMPFYAILIDAMVLGIIIHILVAHEPAWLIIPVILIPAPMVYLFNKYGIEVIREWQKKE